MEFGSLISVYTQVGLACPFTGAYAKVFCTSAVSRSMTALQDRSSPGGEAEPGVKRPHSHPSEAHARKQACDAVSGEAARMKAKLHESRRFGTLNIFTSLTAQAWGPHLSRKIWM